MKRNVLPKGEKANKNKLKYNSFNKTKIYIEKYLKEKTAETVSVIYAKQY